MSPLKQNHAILSTVAREVLREVREQHRAGRLGFLVGAGLSVPIGLPGWAAFNESLLENAIGRHAPGGASHTRALSRAYLDLLQGQSLAAVDLVRQRVGADFHVVLRQALYEREQLRKFQPTEVHYALARLALDSQPPFPCLHTTNYDDLLELTIANMIGKRPRAVHANRRSASDGPRVVHLHGYFPYDFPGAAEEKRLAAELVASDLDYHRLSNDHAAWTNRELMTLLDARSVLIVGMSLTDPNVRRLLAYLSEHKKAHDDAHDHFVILQQRPPMADADQQRASEMLEDDEYKFWHGQGVKILRLSSWDGLNYLLRRIRFTDEEWDRRHKELRVQWATENYRDVDFQDPTLQDFGTELLAYHRDRIVATVGLAGRVEVNLFLPMLDGRYRRALSSMPRRALEAPRVFVPKHDAQTLPEVELALTVGETLKRSSRTLKADTPPPAGEPPFQDWYRSLVSVPYFDYPAGGVPVALLQLVSADPALADAESQSPTMAAMRSLMREAITGAVHLLRGGSTGRIMEGE
ncbi:MAG TPA: SIR2 family protein [Polyangia bacterium]